VGTDEKKCDVTKTKNLKLADSESSKWNGISWSGAQALENRIMEQEP
jgi:hypothetical protein